MSALPIDVFHATKKKQVGKLMSVDCVRRIRGEMRLSHLHKIWRQYYTTWSKKRWP